MKKDIKFYFKLFASTFYLSVFTFGGGFAVMPLIQNQVIKYLTYRIILIQCVKGIC